MDIRVNTAINVIATQAAIILLIAVGSLFLSGWSAVQASVTGGVIGLLATIVFSLRLFVGRKEWSPQKFLQRFYRAEVQKLLLISILLFAAIAWIGLSPLPLTLSCAAVLMANWLVLLIRI